MGRKKHPFFWTLICAGIFSLSSTPGAYDSSKTVVLLAVETAELATGRLQAAITAHLSDLGATVEVARAGEVFRQPPSPAA